MNDPLLIDTDIWIEGERQPAVIANWLADQGDVATCDTVRAEFLVGVHAPRQPATREKARRYFEEVIACTPSLPVDRADFDQAGRLIGDAIRNGQARPTLGDGLIAACALRNGRTVATKNEKDFHAMGVATVNPLIAPPP